MTDLHFLFPPCLLQHDRSTLFPSCLIQHDRSRLSLSVLFITASSIYTFSSRPVYYSMTDLHFFFPSCLLETDRSTVSLSNLFTGAAHHISTVCLLLLFITARQIYTSVLAPVYYSSTDLHFLFPPCLLEHDRSILSLSVQFIRA